MVAAPETQLVGVERRLTALLRVQTRAVSHLHLTGLADAGVVESVRRVERALAPKVIFLYVNCAYADGNQKALLRSIAACIDEHRVLSQYRVKMRSDCPADLVESLDDLSARLHSGSSIVVVLECASSLARLPATALSTLLAIPKQLSSPCLRWLTVDERGWSHIASSFTECVSSPPPVQLEKDMLSKDDVIRCIISSLSPSRPPAFDQFARFVVDTAHLHCVNPHLLGEMTRLAWEEYLSRGGDGAKLQLPSARAAIRDTMNYLDPLTRFVKGDQNECTTRLPITARFLLVASYCATHNPANTDKRYFNKSHGREQRSEARERTAAIAAEIKDAAPRGADVERVVFIARALEGMYGEAATGGGEGVRCVVDDALPQLASLCEMGLLARASAAGNLDQPKLRCLLALDTAHIIAKSLDMNLQDHLDRR